VVSPPGKRRGRPPGSPPNRQAILAAAGRAFAERGFEGVSVRAIATAAGVDAALVHHYFGSKERLLLAAFQAWPSWPAGDLLAGGAAGLGERLVRGLLAGGWEPLVGLLRSAAGRESASRLLREGLEGRLRPLAEAYGRSRPDLRAALAASELLGLAAARWIVRAEPVASMQVEALVAWYGPALQRQLAGRLPAQRSRFRAAARR
jgi:AcrR family transcriptional regulator